MVELSGIFTYFLTKPFLIFCILRIREALLLQEMRASDGSHMDTSQQEDYRLKGKQKKLSERHKHMTPVLSDCIEDKNLQTGQGLWVSIMCLVCTV